MSRSPIPARRCEKVLRNLREHLRPVMRRALRRPLPSARLPPRFDLFAVAQRRFNQQRAIRATHLDAVAPIRTRLLSADIKLSRAVDRRVPQFLRS